MRVPDWWEAVLLSLAAWRCFQLIAKDDITAPLRRYVTRLDRNWEKEGDFTGDAYRVRLGQFLDCPYCAGFWIALIWWIAWQIEDHGTLVAATPFVLSAGVIGAYKLLTSD